MNPEEVFNQWLYELRMEDLSSFSPERIFIAAFRRGYSQGLTRAAEICEGLVPHTLYLDQIQDGVVAKGLAQAILAERDQEKEDK